MYVLLQWLISGNANRSESSQNFAWSGETVRTEGSKVPGDEMALDHTGCKRRPQAKFDELTSELPKDAHPENTGPGGVPVVLLTDRAPLPSGARWASTWGEAQTRLRIWADGCATPWIHQDFTRNRAAILPLPSHVHSSPHRTNPRQPLVTRSHIWELDQQLPRIITGLCAAAPSPHDQSASICLASCSSFVFYRVQKKIKLLPQAISWNMSVLA